MNVQPVNNNSSTSFGAKVKVKAYKSDIKRLVDCADRAYGNKLLSKLEAYHPDETITIGMKIDKLMGPIMYAKNSKTGCVITERCSTDKCGNLGDSKAFYKLVEDMLNPNLLIHNDFWEKKPNGHPYSMPEAAAVPKDKSGSVITPVEHSIFI